MKKNNIYKIAVISIMIDQIIKLMIINNIKKDIIVIPNIFKITYLKNTGAAFSILQNQNTLLLIISLLVLIFLTKYIKKINIENKLEIISLGIILGGITGNIFDRLLYNSVVDYLSFFNFPVFNLADALIVTGIFILIYLELKKDFIKKL